MPYPAGKVRIIADNVTGVIIWRNLQRKSSDNIMTMLSHPFWQQKGGANLVTIISFFVSVVADVVSYYICKWLDGSDSDN